jgi:transcriptional regulator with XRE-family HTH domain
MLHAGYNAAVAKLGDRSALSTFGRRVAEERVARGWTQEQLAARMRWGSPDYVSRIERGLQNLTIRSAARLARLLGVPLASLLDPGHPEVKR